MFCSKGVVYDAQTAPLSQEKRTFATMKSLDRRIFDIALPSIVSNITVPLLGLVDIGIAGHMGDAVYIGAIAVGSMMFNVIYWLFGFLRMGTGGMTSQALGARDLPRVVSTLLRSLGVAMLLSVLLIVFQVPLRWLALAVISPSADVVELASAYFGICIWGAPAMLGLYALTGWFVGMQNTRVPMVVSLVQNVVNIVASLFFVYLCGMKIEGVALGTLIAQYSGLVVSALLWLRYYSRLHRFAVFRGLFTRDEMSRFLSVNRDIFLRTLFLVSVNFYFLSVGARQGDVVLAVNTLLMTMYTIFSYIEDGFAYAGEAVCGRYYGAGNTDGLRRTVRRLFVWGAVMTVLFTMLYALGGEAFLGLLTDDAGVVEAAGEYYWWAVMIPAAGVSAFILDGVFIGLTATRGMLLSSAVSAAVFFTVCTLLSHLLGNHALWLAFVVYLAMRGAVEGILLCRMKAFSPVRPSD